MTFDGVLRRFRNYKACSTYLQFLYMAYAMASLACYSTLSFGAELRSFNIQGGRIDILKRKGDTLDIRRRCYKDRKKSQL